MSLVISEKFQQILRIVNTNIDGKYSQLTSSKLDSKLREDLKRLKKIRSERGFRVRGQQPTKTTGRRGRTVGVSKKK